MSSQIAERLGLLRAFIQKIGLSAWIAPTSDPHGSEYLDEHYAFRKWLSGFTGSAGTLLVGKDEAALITDSRYWEQAAQQLEGSGIHLIRMEHSYPQEIARWSREHLKKGSVLGICDSLIVRKEAEKLKNTLAREGFFLALVKEDPADTIWTDRPKRTARPIYDHVESPRTRRQKLAVLTQKLKALGADYLLTSALDDIAWIANLRGSDIECNPVFYSYALICGDTGILLFADETQVSDELHRKLLADGVHIRPYQDAAKEIEQALLSEDGCTLIADPAEISSGLFSVLPENISILETTNPIVALKAQKSPEEIALIHEAMVKDGIALVRFYAWLDKHLADGLTEGQTAEKLLEFRREQAGFVSPSFDTICAFGPNAALPHYQAGPDGGSRIEGSGFLLIDSGAQFPQGTTDITRTQLVGQASEEMKADYTAVLRSHIRLAKSVFPEGVSSQAIDAISRDPIWNHFADFGHGTGHGVGFFLNVHEGPQRISYPRISSGNDAFVSRQTAMREGMVTSNEPGIYRPGSWGIRIENLTACTATAENEFGRFLKFKTLTLCPIDLSAVDSSRLLPDEKDWLNEYHTAVREELMPYLDEESAAWLIRKTKDI